MGGFHLFTLANVPVWISPWFLLIPLITIQRDGLAQGLIFTFCVMASLLVHEFGHALVAKRYRLGPQILLHGFGGLTGHARARTDREDALIIAAGPLAGMALAVVSLVALIALVPAEYRDPGALRIIVFGGVQMPMVHTILSELVWLNFFWSIFNALPMWPMDGGQLFRLGAIKLLKPGRGERVTHIVGIVTVVLVALATHFVFNLGPMMMVILAMTAWQNVEALSQGSGQPVRRDNAFSRELLQGAERAYGRGEDDEASRLCHQIRAENNVPPAVLARTWALLGVIATRKGNYEEALSYLRRAPDAPDVVEATAQCFYQLEMYEALGALTQTKAFAKLPRNTREQIEHALADATSA